MFNKKMKLHLPLISYEIERFFPYFYPFCQVDTLGRVAFSFLSFFLFSHSSFLLCPGKCRKLAPGSKVRLLTPTLDFHPDNSRSSAMSFALRALTPRAGAIRALSGEKIARMQLIAHMPDGLVPARSFAGRRSLPAPSPRCLSVSAARLAAEAAAKSDQKHITCTVRDNGVAVVKFDDPNAKVNSLNEAVMQEMGPILAEVLNNPAIKSVVLMSGKTTGFIAGADIKMLEKVQSKEDGTKISREGQEVMARMESSPKPIVAAIMGPCLGGGLEVALSCQYRIAVDGKWYDNSTVNEQCSNVLFLHCRHEDWSGPT